MTAIHPDPPASLAGPASDLPPRTGINREVAIFGIGLVVGQALSAATTPLFTRALGPADFGTLDVLSVLVTLLSTVLLFGLDQAMVASYYHQDSPDSRRALVSSGFTFLLLTGLVGCGAVMLVRGQLTHLLLGGSVRDSVLVAAVVGVPPAVGFMYTNEVLRLARRPFAFAFSGVLRAVVGGAVGAWLALVADWGVSGVLLGLAAGSAAALAYDVVAARRLIGFRLSGPSLRSMLPVGLPLIPMGIAFWSLMVVDRLVLVQFVDLEEVGYYALANKIALLMLWAVYGFRTGWTASVLELHSRDTDGSRAERARALTRSVAGAACMAALLGALATELTAIGGGDDFGTSAGLVPLLLLALVLFSTTVVVQSTMLIHRRTGPMAVHTVVAALVNLAGCLLLVPRWGAQGAAAATLVGFAYLAGGLYLAARRIERVPYDLRAVALVVALTVPYLLLGQVVLGPLWVSVPAKLACFAALPAVLCRMGVLSVPRWPGGLLPRRSAR